MLSKFARKSKQQQAASRSQAGSEQIPEQELMRFPTLISMQMMGIPLTRESYIATRWADNPPEEMSWEHEQQIPPRFRKLTA